MPNLYIFAGVNGAGKSTLTQSQFLSSIPCKINADEISRANGWDWHDNSKNLAAMRIARNNLQKCIQSHETCSFETTFAAHAKTYKRIINYAKSEGFKLCLLYIGLSSAKLAIDRVNERVANGGHGVSEDMVNKRYDKSLKNLSELISSFDSVTIYDNSGQSLVKIYQRKGDKRFFNINLPQWSKLAIESDSTR